MGMSHLALGHRQRKVRPLTSNFSSEKGQNSSLKSPEAHDHLPSVIPAYPWHIRFAVA